jgi:hypothetical protein
VNDQNILQEKMTKYCDQTFTHRNQRHQLPEEATASSARKRSLSSCISKTELFGNFQRIRGAKCCGKSVDGTGSRAKIY